MRLTLQLWDRRKNGRRMIKAIESITEGEPPKEKIIWIWKCYFYQKKGESILNFCRRFLRTEMKDKYDEVESIIAYETNHHSHWSSWIKEPKK